ncbi:MAG: hypothetical protein QY330_00460 [Candidatus Dojkabacteria bacterium]|nr:MAG: hypothetical protein QY330_00460 [Candidatus Dojkabacteria bacterium]
MKINKLKPKLDKKKVKVIVAAVVALVVIIVVLTTLRNLTNSAKPGSILFNFDLFFESVERVVPRFALAKGSFEQDILNERFLELRSNYEENYSEADILYSLDLLSDQITRVEDAFKASKDQFYAPNENDLNFVNSFDAQYNIHVRFFDAMRRERKTDTIVEKARDVTTKYRVTKRYSDDLLKLVTDVEEDKS